MGYWLQVTGYRDKKIRKNAYALAYVKKKYYLCAKFGTMKQFFRMALMALVIISYSLPAFSWGQKGHRIIAQIAYNHLNSKARKTVDKVLGDHGMIYWSNWPDEIKSDTIYPQSIKDGWHYQNFEGGMSDEAVADALVHFRPEGGNLFRAIDSLERRVQSTEYRAQTDSHILRFIVHLSGDRYCPMHVAHPDDRGGNGVKMKWFGSNTNLHSVWDTKLIDSQGYSYTEYAQKLEREYAHRKKAIEAMSDAELLLQTYHIVEAIYAYQESWDGNAYHYIYHWRQPMEEQLYIAGIRLAKLLNELCR